jgi:hypothetical protein
LLEALLACGFQARVLRLEGGGEVHAVVEAWDDPRGQWVLLDPRHDLHYAREGRPLSAADLADAAATAAAGEVSAVRPAGTERADPREIARARRRRVCARTDLLSRRLPRWHPRYFGNVWQGLWRTPSSGMSPQQVRVTAAPGFEPGSLALTFATYTPNFAGFEARRNGGAWEPTEERLAWALRPGRNLLEVRARNELGGAGRASVVEVSVPPPR